MARLWSLTIISAFVALGLMSCGRVSGPTEQDVASYLKEQISPNLDIEEMRLESFLEKDGNSGRASCAGTLVLNTDLYTSDWETLGADEKRVGGDRWMAHRAAVGTAEAVRVVHKAGDTTPFTAEVFFRRVVDGWKMEGDPPNYENFAGHRLSEFRAGALITGSAEYKAHLARIVEEKNLQGAAKTALMRDIQKFFGPDKPISFYSNREGGSNPQELYVVKPTGPLKWDSESTEAAMAFSVPGEARRVSQNASSLFEAGDMATVVISGEIVAPGKYGYEEVAGKWTARMCLNKGETNIPCKTSLVLWVGEYFKDWPPYQYSPRDAYTFLVKHRDDGA